MMALLSITGMADLLANIYFLALAETRHFKISLTTRNVSLLMIIKKSSNYERTSYLCRECLSSSTLSQMLARNTIN